jgi:protein-disulfide isomerase
MPFRTPFVPLALACTLVVAVPSRLVEAAEVTAAQRQQIESMIHDYLMANPGVLIEALRAAEDRRNGEADAKSKEVLVDRQNEIFGNPATPVGGNPRGEVAIVEFFDYRCPYCKKVEPSLRTLLSQDHQLRIVYKEMPVLGPQSEVAARAALAAHRQGKFEAFHTALMAAKGQITEDTIYTVASSVGLDIDKLKGDMAAPEIDQALKANVVLAEALNIRGTPGFIIGDHIVRGALDLDALEKMVADAHKG